MKELSIEEKAKAYDGLIERLKDLKFSCRFSPLSDTIDEIFPELKESEDESIRKEIIDFIYDKTDTYELREKSNSWLAWLEKQGKKSQKVSIWKHWKNGICGTGDNKQIFLVKQNGYYSISSCLATECDYIELLELDKILQGEQKSDDKVEPKFKVGNWYQCTKDFFGKGVTFDKNTAYYCAKEGCLQDEYGCHIAIVKDLYDNFKLWTIQDAKPGDVLTSELCDTIMLYKGIEDNNIQFYCDYDISNIDVPGNRFSINDGQHYGSVNDSDDWHPATKEQRDILFQKMKEAGYEWDAEKKELKKIERKHTGKVDPIVVKDFNSVFSREQIEEIDKRIEKSQRLYNANLRDAMRKVEDFPMTD